MATSRELQLLLTLKDEASKELNNVESRVSKLQPTFKKMAAIGTAAFAGIAYGVKQTTDAAGEAEGSWNKFNTVFADGADEMRDFIEDLRTEMPTATHEIARMAADLQDLLVPMGIARDEAQDMSAGFLDVANKIAAFNDVDPTRVLEAIRSGLAGSSEPLQRFGVNARQSALEATALKEGLLEAGQSFRTLEPEVMQQIRAQALLSQVVNNSSDAIEGFEENQDSYIRRQQELNATLKEATVAIGTALLPVIDDLLKATLPVIKAVTSWIQENPRLTKTIVITTAALTALVAVVGTLGIVIGALSAPVLIAIGVITALVAIVTTLVLYFDDAKEAVGQFADYLFGAEGPLNGFRDHLIQVADGFEIFLGKIRSALQTVKDFTRELIRAEEHSFLLDTVGGGFNDITGGLLDFSGSYDTGGVVPGRRGQPSMAMVHGGETILPTHKKGFAGAGGVTVNVYGDVSGRDVVEKVKRSLERSIKHRTRIN